MTQQATREVTIIARSQFKNNAKAVVYQVLSSDDATKYYTTVYDGKATSCTCPAKKPCYHMVGCESYEAARKEQPAAVIAQAVAIVTQSSEYTAPANQPASSAWLWQNRRRFNTEAGRRYVESLTM